MRSTINVKNNRFRVSTQFVHLLKSPKDCGMIVEAVPCRSCRPVLGDLVYRFLAMNFFRRRSERPIQAPPCLFQRSCSHCRSSLRVHDGLPYHSLPRSWLTIFAWELLPTRDHSDCAESHPSEAVLRGSQDELIVLDPALCHGAIYQVPSSTPAYAN